MTERRPELLPQPVPMLVAEPEPVGAYDAKTHLAGLLDRVAEGQRFVITRHGRAVAMLTPIHEATDADRVVDAIRSLAASLPAGPFDIRAARDEGRA